MVHEPPKVIARPPTDVELPSGIRVKITVTFADVDGYAQPVGFEVKTASFDKVGDALVPLFGNGGVVPFITAELVRSVSVADVIRTARAGIQETALAAAATEDDPKRAARHRRAADVYGQRAKAGAERDLAEVAAEYRSAVNKGKSPHEAIARRWQRSESTAAKWIMAARAAGHLGPAQRGKAGEVPERRGKAGKP